MLSVLTININRMNLKKFFIRADEYCHGVDYHDANS